MPSYLRSLLAIEVPLRVTLAEKKQSVSQLLSLGPGSIIQFEKPCDAPLDLEVGQQRIAQGEAVKVGEKFGLRIATIETRRERFETVAGTGGNTATGNRAGEDQATSGR